MATTQQDVEMTESEQVHPLQTQFDDAEDVVAALVANASPDAAIQAFQTILSYGTRRLLFIFLNNNVSNAIIACLFAAAEEDAALEQVQRVKEHSIYKLAQLYIQFGREKELATLLQSLRPFFATLARAKTGKIGAACRQ